MQTAQQPYASIDTLSHPSISAYGVRVSVLRLDQYYPELSGNKYFKLKLNLEAAREQGFKQLISFGGAFSNHIHALAYAAKHAGLESIGVIRGESMSSLNPTLHDAQEHGMKLHFVSREQYRFRNEPEYHQSLIEKFGASYIIPEGGSNDLAVQGCTKIADHINASLQNDFDTVILPCGTGATMAGVVSSLSAEKTVLGISVLKGAQYLDQDIQNMLQACNSGDIARWKLLHDYHGGGYAKCDVNLARFINDFNQYTNIAIEPVYSAKMFMALDALIVGGVIESGSHVVAIHTGGMQGLRGMQGRIDHLLSKAS